MNVNDSVYIKMIKLTGIITEIKQGNDGTQLYIVKYKNAMNQDKHIKCNTHGLTEV
jgi:hypothetical protein